PEKALTVYMTPSLMSAIAHQRYGEQWAADLKSTLRDLNLGDRPPATEYSWGADIPGGLQPNVYIEVSHLV
ncbi:MAG: hypothetical protein R6U20_13805, partial [Longimonas sp.]